MLRNGRRRRRKKQARKIRRLGRDAPGVRRGQQPDWRKSNSGFRKFFRTEEHRSARATTLNAHYTAPTVIGAMYRAAERFGFKGGACLNPPAASATRRPHA